MLFKSSTAFLLLFSLLIFGYAKWSWLILSKLWFSFAFFWVEIIWIFVNYLFTNLWLFSWFPQAIVSSNVCLIIRLSREYLNWIIVLLLVRLNLLWGFLFRWWCRSFLKWINWWFKCRFTRAAILNRQRLIFYQTWFSLFCGRYNCLC